jgi:Fur family ferric uptake transcriptional regulator/Fur family peroxide stress response transcriptional regulator
MLDTEWRLTPQRRAVLEVLEAATDHPTAAEVFERVRVASPGIGPATVYRSLGLLVANGLALELSLGDGAAARYDGNVSRHDHLVCTSCGAASDIQTALPPQVVEQLTNRTGYAISHYDVQFHGLCPNCQSPTTHPQEEMNG